jgi:ATP-dependent Lon protease
MECAAGEPTVRRVRSFFFENHMATRQTLPVLPLRGTVIFPGLTAPIAAGRPGTLRAIESALKGERLVFAVAQRDNTDEPTPDILYSMGVIARISQIQRGLGGVQLLLQGEQRATALQFTTTEGFLSAVVDAGGRDETGQRERSQLRRAP